MPHFQGILRKMKTEWGNPIHYSFCIGRETIPLNSYLQKPVEIIFTGSKFCIQCERKTNKIFQQGYCYPCYQRLLECNLCVIHPERCQVVHKGCPKDDWAHAHCHPSHIVYLANASGLKVGITRETQIPFRWIDQGAIQALPIIRVKNRFAAGYLEIIFKNWVGDKTNWRVMLKNEVVPMDLVQAKKELKAKMEPELRDKHPGFGEAVEWLDSEGHSLHYPVLTYPNKITSLSFDKTPQIVGNLQGIKGQYLFLDQGVINLRKFSGYEISLSL